MMKRWIFLLGLFVCAFLIISVSAEAVTRKEITVHFTDVNRTGLYSGEVNEKGNPDGFGVFEAINGEGNRYIVVGDWADGHQTGEAWKLWENGDINIGYFEDGHFVYGKYARDVKFTEYDERPKFPDAEGKLISYEELLKYGELFDPSVINNREPGTVPVQLEAITTEVIRGDYGITIKAWIKGEQGYYYHDLFLDNDKPIADEKTLEALQTNQRISIMVTPYADGTFYSKQMCSISILENGVDIKDITLAEFKTYEELSQMNVENPAYDKETGVMEMIIGNPSLSQVWIKGEEGYVQSTMVLNDFPVERGQRWYIVVKPYDGHVFQHLFIYSLLVEENVDVKPFEDAQLESEKAALAEDPIRKHLLEPFDSNEYNELSYKKILRNIEDYAGSAIRIEGKYKQDLNDSYIDRERALMADSDGNYYHLYMMKEPIDVVEFNLLDNDTIIVYGYIEDSPYEYTSWTGEKTVPSIFVIHIDLLEDE